MSISLICPVSLHKPTPNRKALHTAGARQKSAIVILSPWENLPAYFDTSLSKALSHQILRPFHLVSSMRIDTVNEFGDIDVNLAFLSRRNRRNNPFTFTKSHIRSLLSTNTLNDNLVTILQKRAFQITSNLYRLLPTFRLLKQTSNSSRFRSGYRSTSQQIASLHVTTSDRVMSQHLWKRVKEVLCIGLQIVVTSPSPSDCIFSVRKGSRASGRTTHGIIVIGRVDSTVLDDKNDYLSQLSKVNKFHLSIVKGPSHQISDPSRDPTIAAA